MDETIEVSCDEAIEPIEVSSYSSNGALSVAGGIVGGVVGAAVVLVVTKGVAKLRNFGQSLIASHKAKKAAESEKPIEVEATVIAEDTKKK